MMANVRNRVRAVEASRMSKVVGAKDKSIGMARRSESVERYCLAYDLDLVAVAEDPDVSGGTDPFQRKGLGPWLTQRARDWDVLIAEDIERIGRSARHLTHLRDWAEDTGHRIIVLSPHLEWPVEPGDVASGLMWDMLGRMAQWELENITKRNRETREYLESHGKLARKAPYGYRIVGDRGDKSLEIDPVTGPILKEAADRYLAGETLEEIAEDFTARGLPSRNKPSKKYDGPRWSRGNKLGEYLRDPAICGRVQQGDHILRCPPIIPIAQHKKIVARLDSRAHSRGTKRDNVRMLSRILKCGYCQETLSPIVAGRPPKRYEYYYCRNRKCPRKPRLMIPRIATEAEVVWKIAELFKDEPVYETRIKPGMDYQDEIDGLILDLQALSPLAAEDPVRFKEESDAIIAQINHYRSLPTTEPEEIRVPIPGRYLADDFADADPETRQKILSRAGIRFVVTREGDDVNLQMVVLGAEKEPELASV